MSDGLLSFTLAPATLFAPPSHLEAFGAHRELIGPACALQLPGL